jgi:Icc protein
MTKIVWISDLHFLAEGRLYGIAPRVRLTAAVDYINRTHADCEHCIISGDLVNREDLEDYQALKVHLERLECSYLPMLGNHDDRDLMRSVFDLPETVMPDFIQYEVETKHATVLCLDTHKPGFANGELCSTRRSWLRSALDRAGDKPVHIFMHHPPMDLGLPQQDTSKLEAGETFLDLISEFANVAHLYMGHVHRLVSGTIRGIPFSTMNSVSFQARAPKPEWTWDSFKTPPEPPLIGVLNITERDVILQYEQFCEFETGT